MFKFYLNIIVCLSALLIAGAVTAEDNQAATTDYSVWLGSHYTDFKDNPNKVGEYNLGNDDDILPEFKLNVISRSNGKLIYLNSHYYDKENVNARLKGIFGDRLNFEVKYRSLTKQQGQDLLDNMQAQEFAGLNADFTDKAGGKMITHEITDPGADYNYNRHEIMTKVSLLLSKKNNLKLVAAHRSILKKGTEQLVTSNHCYSCHLTSKTVDVDKQTHQIEAGLEADVKDYSVGYTMGYRTFKSKIEDATADYDNAQHPVTGGNGGEFGPRLIYEDTTLPYGVYPETEKMSHKVRLKGKVGKGRIASSFAYSKTTNNNTDLNSDAISGAINYTVPLSPKTRLIAKASVIKLTADDPFIDLPTYREGTPAPPYIDFDFTRYSSIDRLDGKFSAEVITRLNNRWTLSVLGEFRRIDRDDYPVYNEGLTTNKIIGQAKFRYRNGLKYTSSFKYRYEKTSDPYVSGKGLFEDIGRDILEPLEGSSFIFYLQREDLRYQNITTEPTDKHQFDWNLNWQSNNEVSFNIAAKVSYDKNSDLDSLDVEHFSALPGFAINFMPDARTVFTSGYTYGYYKSRGPVAVALFDG
ncbi:MAG: GSU2204 family CXXCH-containing (seleno)protein [bacterium]